MIYAADPRSMVAVSLVAAAAIATGTKPVAVERYDLWKVDRPAPTPAIAVESSIASTHPILRLTLI